MKDTFCFFTTYDEAAEAQNYDHLFQRAFNLATASGVEMSVIRELNLHINNDKGELPLDQYIAENNIVVEFPDIYEYAKNLWDKTSAWAVIYKYGDGYVYFKDHSDRTYTLVVIEDSSLLRAISDTGAEINLEEF